MSLEIRNTKDLEFRRIKDLVSPESLLKEAAEIVEKHNVGWFLSFGTALGFYRDGDFIPDDSDIDISIVATGDHSPLIEELKSKYHHLRSVKWCGRDMQEAFYRDDGLVLDIQFFYADLVGGYLVTCADTLNGEVTYRDNKKNIFPIKKIKTKYGRFPFPRDLDSYLVSHYGNWKEKGGKSITNPMI